MRVNLQRVLDFGVSVCVRVRVRVRVCVCVCVRERERERVSLIHTLSMCICACVREERKRVCVSVMLSDRPSVWTCTTSHAFTLTRTRRRGTRTHHTALHCIAGLPRLLHRHKTPDDFQQNQKQTQNISRLGSYPGHMPACLEYRDWVRILVTYPHV